MNSFETRLLLVCLINRVIRKARKTQHKNPEFGHTQGEIQEKPAGKKKSTLAFKGDETQKTINFGGKLSGSTAATYISLLLAVQLL